MARRLIVLVALLVPLMLAACGDDDEEETTAAESPPAETAEEPSGGGETIQISETEFALDPSEVTAAAGEITFEIANDGSIPHNLEVEGEGVEEVSSTIEGGASDSLTVSLEPGTYELYCAIGNHAEQGMAGELTVE